MFRFQYILFYTFALTVMIIPRSVRHRLFKGFASFLYLILKRKREVIYANLELAFKGTMSQKKKDEIGKVCFQNLIIEVLSIIEIYFSSQKILAQNISLLHEERVKELKKANKPIIFIIHHYGNLELGGLALGKVSQTLHVVQPANNPYIDNFVKRSREKYGIRTIPMKKAVKHLAIQLKNRRDVSLVVDQGVDMHSGTMVQMFDEPTSHINTASYLARKFDAVLLPVEIKQKSSLECELCFHEPIAFSKSDNEETDIHYLTQMQATVLEKMIVKDPYPWFWCHKRWKDTHPEIYAKRS